MICNINEANQTGAHIFPAWMIASAFDDEARNREHEVIHSFSPLDAKLPYFGRSVPLKKIEENIGRELTDEEAKGQQSQLIVNNFWCRSCEKKLKVVEDYFLENVDRKLNDFTTCNNAEMRKLPRANIYLVRLFFYSLIYRSAITKLMGFELDKKTSDKLKFFLQTFIQDDLKTTIKFLENSEIKNELLDYPIKCLKTEDEVGKTSNFVFIHNKYDKPFCFIINCYILQFFTKEKHKRSTPYTFFGITDVISKMVDLLNFKETEFRIGLINLKLWSEIKSKFVKHYSYQRMENYILIYKKMFETEFGRTPDKSQITRFLNKLTDNNYKLGVKYTMENIVEAMNKSLKR